MKTKFYSDSSIGLMEDFSPHSTAERLLSLRSRNRLTQTEVARRMGVTSSLISAYETQGRNPSIDKLVQLADIYHASTDYILGRTSRHDDEIYLDVSHLNEHQVRLLRGVIDEMEYKNDYLS